MTSKDCTLETFLFRSHQATPGEPVECEHFPLEDSGFLSLKDETPGTMFPIEFMSLDELDDLEDNTNDWTPTPILGTTTAAIDRTNDGAALMEMGSFLSEAGLGEAPEFGTLFTPAPSSEYNVTDFQQHPRQRLGASDLSLDPASSFLSWHPRLACMMPLPYSGNEGQPSIEWKNGMPGAHSVLQQEYVTLPRHLPYCTSEHYSWTFLYPVHADSYSDSDDIIPMLAEIENEIPSEHMLPPSPTSYSVVSSTPSNCPDTTTSISFAKSLFPTVSATTKKAKHSRPKKKTTGTNTTSKKKRIRISVTKNSSRRKQTISTGSRVRISTANSFRSPQQQSTIPPTPPPPSSSIWVRRSTRCVFKDSSNKEN